MTENESNYYFNNSFDILENAILYCEELLEKSYIYDVYKSVPIYYSSKKDPKIWKKIGF